MEILSHDQAHAALFRAVLRSEAIGSLSMDFSGIDFSNRASVLNAARDIKDLMVSAYNGLGVYCSDSIHLGFIGKIASVEARHASVIREMLLPNSFADVSIINPVSGVDIARSPTDALMLIHPYIHQKLNTDKLQLA
ncbi:MAG: ferritin-like domain-containing protein [Bacteroidetes bacterium]|nr:ferritin-like domain-containing protein [Bacteroidota bacterium]